MSKISVIMSVYNEKKEWLKEAIESILNQSYKNFEFIIIIDNPQRIDLIEIVKKYAAKDNRIYFEVNSSNKGLIFSLNKALEYAKGEYIARMDADDIAHKDRLKKQLSYLKKNNLDLIGSNINLFNEDGIFAKTDKLLTHRYIKKILKIGTIEIVHPTFFANKEVFTALNGYNSKALHVEDKDFLARAICRGFKVGNMKEVLLNCRYSKNSITKKNAFYIHYNGSMVTKAFKNCLKNQFYNLKIDLSYIDVQEEKFAQSKYYLSKAKEMLNQKRINSFLFYIIKALILAPQSFVTIKIHLARKILKLQENLELKLKK